jgi:hypothetical protein
MFRLRFVGADRLNCTTDFQCVHHLFGAFASLRALWYSTGGGRKFLKHDAATGGDGMVSGQPGMESVYTWYAGMEGHSHGGRYMLKGNVTLLR